MVGEYFGHATSLEYWLVIGLKEILFYSIVFSRMILKTFVYLSSFCLFKNTKLLKSSQLIGLPSG